MPECGTNKPKWTSVAFPPLLAPVVCTENLNSDIVVMKPAKDRALNLTPQNDQLMAENRILGLKSALRFERRDQNSQNEAEQSEHGPQTVGDSFG